MSKKTVSLKSKPATSKRPNTANDWVDNKSSDPMKRLTIDVPASLHAQIKSQCALRHIKMADEIRAVLEKHFLKS